MQLQYSDEMLQVVTGVEVPGRSFSQKFNDVILFTMVTENAHLVQFKARTLKWLSGPSQGKYDDSIRGYSYAPDELNWSLDVVEGQTEDPYYDTGGYCKRVNGRTIIVDQPGVDWVTNFDPSDGMAHPAKDKFRGVSIIIINNRASHMVEWSRTGIAGANYYKVKVNRISCFPIIWKVKLIEEGFAVPDVP